MTTYVMRGGKLVEKRLAELHAVASAPNVISDCMEPTRHMATGRMHTSKSEFRRDTKATGCVEYGNDPALLKPRKPVVLSREQRRNDIKRAIYDLRNGVRK